MEQLTEPEMVGAVADPSAGGVAGQSGTDSTATELVVRLAVRLGAAVVVVQSLYVLFIVYSGLSLNRVETQIAAGPLIRVGASFSGHVNVITGLALLVATLMLAAPIASAPHRHLFAGTRSAALFAVQAVSLMVIAGSIAGVRATVFFLPPLGHHLSASQRWELIAYVTGTAGTALLAGVAAFVSRPGAWTKAPVE